MEIALTVYGTKNGRNRDASSGKPSSSSGSGRRENVVFFDVATCRRRGDEKDELLAYFQNKARRSRAWIQG